VNDTLLDVALVVVLIGVNALLAGSEMAFVSLREGQIRRMASTRSRGRRVAQLAKDPNRYLSAIQLGITLASFLASAAVAVSVGEPLAGLFGFLGPYSTVTAVALATVCLSMISLVFGELVPKRLAMQKAERWSLFMVRPIGVLISVTRPIIIVLSAITDALVRALGGDPALHRDDVTDEEIVDLVDAQSSLTDTQRQIMGGAIEIAERPLRQILVPRNRVVAVSESMSAAEALSHLRSSGHSRAPVMGGDLDNIVGQVHLRDLIDGDQLTGQKATTILALPETLSVLEALRQLQLNRTELAIVVNEYGGTAGIVTIEDLVEELVGEIYDEADHDLLTVQHTEQGAIICPGSFPMHDLIDIGLDLPQGDYATIAGLVLDRLGRLPEVGEHLTVSGYDLEVLAMDRRSITSVSVYKPLGDSAE